MSHNRSKFYRMLLIPLAVIGLPVLLFAAIRKAKSNTKEMDAIRSTLSSYGISEGTIRLWIAVSALETNGWTSKVFQDSNNLFCLIIPKSKRLDYGEGQTIFMNEQGMYDSPLHEAADALYRHVILPFKYKLEYSSIDELVTAMKERKYFTASINSYLTGVKFWYPKLFPPNA